MLGYARSEFELGQVVKAVRHAQGLTQAEVAHRAHVSRPFVIALERGTGPRAEVGRVFAVLRALGLRLTVEEDTSPDFATALAQLLEQEA